MISLDVIRKEIILLDGEKLLSLNIIADIYDIPRNIMHILFSTEYVGKYKIKEYKDYYIFSRDMYNEFGIESSEKEEVLVSLTGFIQISLEIMKGIKSNVDKDVKEEQMKLVVSNAYFTNNNSNELKMKLENKKINDDMQEDIPAIEEPIGGTWRQTSNRAISSLVRITNLSYEEIRNVIYGNIKIKYHVDLELRLENVKKRLRLSGFSESKIKKLNYVDAIATDKSLINMYLSEIIVFAADHKLNLKLNKIA